MEKASVEFTGKVVVLDTIVFELQRFGGISSIWEKILEGVMAASDIEAVILYSPEVSEKLKQIAGDRCSRTLNEVGPPLIRRFTSPQLPRNTQVYHSSYFRVAKRGNVQNVVTVHDCILEKSALGVKSLIHRFIKWRALRNACSVICVSENTKCDLMYHYPWLNADSIHVVHNGIDLTFFSPKSSLDHENYLLFVGSRRNYKNFPLALKLLSSQWATDNDLNLVVVGGGDFSPGELKEIGELGLSDRVKNLGSQNREQLRDLYQSAYALIYPSFYEGFGLPPIEAMACGCPVLCSNTSSLPEVVGDAALMFDPLNLEQAINAAKNLSDEIVRERIRHAGIDRASRFSCAAMVENTLQVYRLLLR